MERGLEQIIRKCGPPNWTVEAVKAHVVSGHAGLFICEAGFVVLEQRAEDVSGRPYLNVWLCCVRPRWAQRNAEAFGEWLDKVASAIGCQWWEFSSPREGWKGIERYLPVKAHMTIWRREL